MTYKFDLCIGSDDGSGRIGRDYVGMRGKLCECLSCDRECLSKHGNLNAQLKSRLLDPRS